MPAEEREVRARNLVCVVEENSVEKWVATQFADIRRKLDGG
jgi:trehalose-6-phosphate synthase